MDQIDSYPLVNNFGVKLFVRIDAAEEPRLRKKRDAHCTMRRMYVKSTHIVLGHSLVRSLVRPHRSLINHSLIRSSKKVYTLLTIIFKYGQK